MTRQKVKDIISAHVRYYGRGYKYECQLNGEYVDGMTEIKNKAEKGDKVIINVYQGHQGYWKERYLTERISFKIEMNEENKQALHFYKKVKNSSVYAENRNDYQKSKLYKWERSYFENFKTDLIANKEECTPEKAQDYIEPIFEKYGMKVPEVKFHSARERSCTYYPRFNEIRIGNWGYSKIVLIHESAHAVVKQLGLSNFVASHGPLFISVYIYILSEYYDENLNDLQYSLKKFDIDYIEDFDLNYWIEFKENDGEIGLEDLNYLRQENYVLSDGTKLTDNQIEVFRQIKNGETDIDGRSARALANRDIVKKNGKGYELTERGENVVV